MITFEMNLIPYGSRLYGEDLLIKASIWTTMRGDEHAYRIVDNEENVIAEGAVPKAQSGHRNPLHLLNDILAQLPLDHFKEDYITTKWDV